MTKGKRAKKEDNKWGLEEACNGFLFDFHSFAAIARTTTYQRQEVLLPLSDCVALFAAFKQRQSALDIDRSLSSIEESLDRIDDRLQTEDGEGLADMLRGRLERD